MEYLPLGDLEKYITPALKEDDTRIVMKQILDGLQILHGYYWAHRDLTPRNIFVVEQGPHWWVKIGDFGLSKRFRGQQSLITMAGTPDYMAPEILASCFNNSAYGGANTNVGSYTVAVDMWSLGCILHRLLTRQLPFSSEIVRGS
jgi:serine/threonine protein kinase